MAIVAYIRDDFSLSGVYKENLINHLGLNNYNLFIRNFTNEVKGYMPPMNGGSDAWEERLLNENIRR